MNNKEDKLKKNKQKVEAILPVEGNGEHADKKITEKPSSDLSSQKSADEKDGKNAEKAVETTTEPALEIIPVPKKVARKSTAKAKKTEGEEQVNDSEIVNKKTGAKTKAAVPKKAATKKASKTAELPKAEEAIVEKSSPVKKPATKKAKKDVVQPEVEKVEVKEPVAVKKKAVKKESAPVKKSAAKQDAKKTVGTDITFCAVEVRFYTRPGEELYVTGNHPIFGNGDHSKALKMGYLSHDIWTATFPLQKADIPAEGITYNFLVKYPNGVTAMDWGNDKIIKAEDCKLPKLHIKDSWNHPGYYENAFYSEPFLRVLLKNAGSSPAKNTNTLITHVFKVKAPLLLKNQALCIIGNDVALGAWDEAKAVLLTKEANGVHYMAGIDLGSADFPVVYKYAIYDVEAKEVIRYEDGENRVLHGDSNDETFTIVNDGFVVLPNDVWKGAGVAVPVFSLRSDKSFGVGGFTDIKLLADWAHACGMQLIQLLPVNDTTAAHSWADSYPYAAISAFALHPMYLDLAAIINKGQESLLNDLEKERVILNAKDIVDYEAVNRLKWDFIKTIYPLNSAKIFASADYKNFYKQNEHWLKPYAVFCYLRDKYHTAHFNRWPVFKQYDAVEIEQMITEDAEVKEAIGMYYFVQYHLHLQLKDAADYAHEKGIVLKGDIPIGVYRYSADVWQQPELYNLHLQAGAPPDDFAVHGQNWGFPTYNWEKMKQDDFDWWKRRFKQMSYYFDAFRVDHILGFFRIWSVPYNSLDGIMGHFEPAVPVHINEFLARNIPFDYDRLTKPFITEEILHETFGDQQHYIRNTFLINYGYGHYSIKPEFDSQRKIHDYFKHFENNAHNRWLQQALNGLLANVILFEAENSEGTQFHFRFNISDTSSFKHLDADSQYQLNELYVDYFFRRQDEVWKQEALERLPRLKRSTDMLICGEDLGLVPSCVPDVLKQLGLLSLEIQRMPKDVEHEFFNPADAPYLSVVMPSTHDMSTVRGWWVEDREKSQRFYNNVMHHDGYAPYLCDAWVNTDIVKQHLYSPAMWSIFQLQDILGMNAKIRRDDPAEERINIPAVAKHYWKYRMNMTLENLVANTAFSSELKKYITESGRLKKA